MLQKNDLVRFFELKSMKYDEVKVGIWQEYFKDIPEDAAKAGLQAIVLDVSIINPSAGHVVDYIKRIKGETKSMESEQAWDRVLRSAKAGGSIPITAREAKALNSMGGMKWLRESSPDDTNWQRKEFMEIYHHIPEQVDYDFRCLGLEAEILPDTDTKRLEE